MASSTFFTLVLPVLSAIWSQTCAGQAVPTARLELSNVDLARLHLLQPPANDGQGIMEADRLLQPPGYHTMPPRPANQPQPTTSAWKNIFARQNLLVCTLYTSNGTPWGCTQPDACCPGGGSTWCCSNIYNCGVNGRCAYAYTSTTTVASTSTVVNTITSTNVVSSPGGTQYSTTITTTVVYVTRSDLQTATVVSTITVTSDQRKRQALTNIPSATQAPTIATQAPIQIKEKIHKEKHQPAAIETATSPRHRIELFKRQNVKVTATETTYTYVYITQIRSFAVTVTSSYTVTSLTTSTYTTTSTSAVNAKTTVTRTTTVVVNTNGQQVNNVDTNGTNDNASGGSKGLSKGAQAGIGAGTGAGSLIICIILGFCWRRRRAHKKAKMAAIINQAVAAATSANAPTSGAANANAHLPPAGAAGVMTENKHPTASVHPQPYMPDNRASYQPASPPVYRYSSHTGSPSPNMHQQQQGYEMDAAAAQTHSPQHMYPQQHAYSPPQSYTHTPAQGYASPAPPQGYEMAATYSPQMGSVQTVPVGQQGVHEMYHAPAAGR